MEEHKANKHDIGLYSCDHCGHKAKSFGELDTHIGIQHIQTKKNKNVDMRDLSDRVPCDPYHPSHTSECCDRGYYQQPTKDEKRSRGQDVTEERVAGSQILNCVNIKIRYEQL